MLENASTYIKIPLNHIYNGLTLTIDADQEDTAFTIDEEKAIENGESPYQILEGKSYTYFLTGGSYQLKPIKGIITSIKRNKEYQGRITPGIYVGTLSLELVSDSNTNDTHIVELEVIATKLNANNNSNVIDDDFRENYKSMLSDISEKCTELLMQINSPVNQNFEPDFNTDNKTIYQRFSFVKSLITSTEFNDSIHKIIHSPNTKWMESTELVDIRKIKRFTNSHVKQIASGNNRTKYDLTEEIKSVPNKLINSIKEETIDTPENRFIKFALEKFLKFCEDCQEHFTRCNYTRAQKEADVLVTIISNLLQAPFFKNISRPNTLKLNSPILQRKSGYREVLKAWLIYDLAAKLVWKGGDNVYKAGKRDIAVLYEYWLFFKLYDLFTNNPKFEFKELKHDDKNIDSLIGETDDGLGLKLIAGKETVLFGKYKSDTRELSIRFSYNRTFKGGQKYSDNNDLSEASEGTWTKALRPDYTLSFWPSTIDETKAEKEDIIVHIHFDAKYKVQQFIINEQVQKFEKENEDGDNDDLAAEKTEQRKGIYKNADLLKMHAYKDAIRRTGGAYVLYPGSIKPYKVQGFHELIPGLGAFAVRPSSTSIENDDTGITEVSKFIDEVVKHLLDRTSQRENISSKSYSIHKTKKTDNNILKEPIPEYITENGKEIRLIPDETYVLVGYSNDPSKLKWYKENGLYNFRMDDDKGSLVLESNVVNAKYLLLRENGKTEADKIFKILSKGPKVFAGNKLNNYPNKNPKDYYLVIEIEKEETSDLKKVSYPFKELEKYKNISANSRNKPGIPFAVSLTELMNTIEK